MRWVCIGRRAVRLKTCDEAGRVAATENVVEKVKSKRREWTRMVKLLRSCFGAVLGEE